MIREAAAIAKVNPKALTTLISKGVIEDELKIENDKVYIGKVEINDFLEKEDDWVKSALSLPTDSGDDDTDDDAGDDDAGDDENEDDNTIEDESEGYNQTGTNKNKKSRTTPRDGFKKNRKSKGDDSVAVVLDNLGVSFPEI